MGWKYSAAQRLLIFHQTFRKVQTVTQGFKYFANILNLFTSSGNGVVYFLQWH